MAAGRLVRSFILAVASLALIYGVLHLASRPIDTTTGTAESQPLDLLDPEVVAGTPGTALSAPETLARPIFSKSRRPRAAPDSAAAPIAMTQPATQFTLAGVMINGGSRRALISTPEIPNGEWLTVGEEIGGARVSAIEPQWVEIASPAGMMRLQLYVDNTPPL